MSTALVQTETGVVETPARSLYKLEQEYSALLETEEFGLAEGVEGDFREDLERSLKETVAKRDRTAGFISHCEAQQDAVKREIKRLQARCAMYEMAADRAKQFVRFVIESLGKDAKGKYRKLEGNLATFVLQPTGKNKLNVFDASLVPDEYKRVTVTLPSLLWSEIFRTYAALGAVPYPSAGEISVQEAPDNAAIKDALEAGREVPGAELLMDQHSLRIK